MANFILKLEKYISLQQETQTIILFKVMDEDDIVSLKKITYETNPILDIEILNLRNLKLTKVIQKLHKIYTRNEYKNKFLNSINKFKKELIMDFFPEVINPITP